MKKEPFLVRLERKIERIPFSGCWIFTGHVNTQGYGQSCDDDSRRCRAHRYMYEKVHGVRLLKWQQVCHHCDIPSCVNPSHLFIGSNKDNSLDMHKKGRGVYGESHPDSKLTIQDVRYMRLNPEKLSRRQLAVKLGVSHQSVTSAINLRTWAHSC